MRGVGSPTQWAGQFRVVRERPDPPLLPGPVSRAGGPDVHRPERVRRRPGALVHAGAHSPLRFGYLGTITLDVEQITDLLRGWRLARAASPRLADATLEFRGHIATSNVGPGGAGGRSNGSPLTG